MAMTLMKFRTVGKSASFMRDRRRFTALVQSMGDIGFVGDVPNKEAKFSNSTSLFEPFSAEYVETNDIAPPIPLPGTAPTLDPTKPRWKQSHRVMTRTGLAEVVASGDFARAENLRTELIEANIHIQRDLVYADAALHAWQTKPAGERTEAFYTWFSLMPNAVLGQIRRSRTVLFYVKRTLFSEPTDLNTLACFGLVTCRKGFANFISLDIFAHVARFASPGVSCAFFDECEKAALAFYARFKENTKENSDFSIWQAENFHGAFVRALCLAGHLDVAVERLLYTLDKGITITPFTWVVLLETLSYVGREDLLVTVRNRRATAVEGKSDVDDLKPARDSLSATYLSQMIADYVKLERTRELDQLREEMMESRLSCDLWAAAIMKYYHDIGQHVVVLRQFLRYYTCVGIQKDLVHRYITKGSPWYHRELDKEHPSLPLIRPIPTVRGRNRWPSTHTIAMVWQSIVSFAQDSYSLELLYRDFLDYWDRYRPSASMEGWSVSPQGFPSSMRFQYPPSMKPDTVHFQVFIKSFARLSGAVAAMNVMSDMHARNILPDAHNWTVLAGKYARVDIDNAEKILSRMESTLQDKTLPARLPAPTDPARMLTGPLPRPPDWIPGPTLVTYTTILRGLIDEGKLEQARLFEMRMREAGYASGSYGPTEDVLELLRTRESTPRIPWHQRTIWQP